MESSRLKVESLRQGLDNPRNGAIVKIWTWKFITSSGSRTVNRHDSRITFLQTHCVSLGLQGRLRTGMTIGMSSTPASPFYFGGEKPEGAKNKRLKPIGGKRVWKVQG